MRSYGTTIALAFFLGGIGLHRFYLNQPGVGILYVLFFWTGAPAIIAIIEVIYFLVIGKEKFEKKYG